MIRALLSLYSWRYPHALLALWRQYPRLGAYLGKYWRTNDFFQLETTVSIAQKTSRERVLLAVLYAWSLLSVSAGLALLLLWYNDGLSAGWQFGLALIVSYPIILAYVLPVSVGLWWLLHPKALGREVLCAALEAQVDRLRRRHSFSIVAVVGSIGKTSTKIAIARTLEASRRVQWQEGNYNDRVTVPLIFFGHNEPGIFNLPAWIKILLQNERIIRRSYPYQIVIVELGPDHPGHMREFAYLKPDLAIVTAVTAEHMEYFKTLDAVAEEELTVMDFAQKVLVNTDDTAAKYLEGREYASYGLTTADYTATIRKAKDLRGQDVTLTLDTSDAFDVRIPLLGNQGAKVVLAAAATAHLLGVPLDEVQQGVANVSAFAGRMQILHGLLDSTLIDDTYNSTPVAAKAALDVLQDGAAPQRIAILGSMNELGDYAPEAHREVGEHCDPAKLDWVVTIGQAAKEYLAPVAKARGCQVKSFMDPYKAGRFVRRQVKEGAVVLAKGSQNGVFAEEALKMLLADKADEGKLVRQSETWLATKNKQFGA